MAKPVEKPKANFLKQWKKYILIAILVLVALKISKTLFYIGIFTVTSYIGKDLRGRLGLKMVVFDPMLFCSILVAKFLGLKALLLYVAVNTLIIDILTMIFTIGTFLNFTLYLISCSIAILVFGNFSMLVYGNVASFLYSVLYVTFRTNLVFQSPLADDPIQSVTKGVTSFMFTLLYMMFLGPLLQILMSL